MGGFTRSALCAGCVQNVTIWLHFICQIYLFSKQTNFVCIAEYHKPHHVKTKTHRKGVFVFWWEWVDSNHLSRKTTDLQSAPALQLRRTPRTEFVVRAEGIEPSFQAWKACILAFELCSPLFHRLCDYILFFFKRKHLFCYFYTVYVFT